MNAHLGKNNRHVCVMSREKPRAEKNLMEMLRQTGTLWSDWSPYFRDVRILIRCGDLLLVNNFR